MRICDIRCMEERVDEEGLSSTLGSRSVYNISMASEYKGENRRKPF